MNKLPKKIDYSDIPKLPDEFWIGAKVVNPENKVPVSLRLDKQVLTWFKSQGKRYQTHMNAVLTSYMQANQTR